MRLHALFLIAAAEPLERLRKVKGDSIPIKAFFLPIVSAVCAFAIATVFVGHESFCNGIIEAEGEELPLIAYA